MASSKKINNAISSFIHSLINNKNKIKTLFVMFILFYETTILELSAYGARPSAEVALLMYGFPFLILYIITLYYSFGTVRRQFGLLVTLSYHIIRLGFIFIILYFNYDSKMLGSGDPETIPRDSICLILLSLII